MSHWLNCERSRETFWKEASTNRWINTGKKKHRKNDVDDRRCLKNAGAQEL